MKRTWKTAAIVAVSIALIAGAGTFAFAQTTDPAPGAGTCGGFGMRGFGGNSGVLTDLLGITAEELHQLRTDGKTLAEIAASKGISEDALISALLEPRKEALTAAVAAGRLTQEQANLMLQNMEANMRLQIKSSLGPRGFGCGIAADDGAIPTPGGMRGFGGMRR